MTEYVSTCRSKYSVTKYPIVKITAYVLSEVCTLPVHVSSHIAVESRWCFPFTPGGSSNKELLASTYQSLFC